MNTITRDMLDRPTIIINVVKGLACPRCKTESWVYSNTAPNGYCHSCAYADGLPLKIIDDVEKARE